MYKPSLKHPQQEKEKNNLRADEHNTEGGGP